MPYPTLYDITYSYNGFQQAQQGISAFPGTQLDADLAGLTSSIDGLAAFVERTIRSDGALNNGIVTFDSLSPALQTNGIAAATAWLTGTKYFIGSPVVVSGSLYRCLVAHLSGAFDTDLAAGKWIFVCSVSGSKSDPVNWGGVCDGNSHPLSSVYSTLAAAQAVYPFSVALTDELDWAAIQKMAYAGQPIKLSNQSAFLNRQITLSGIPFCLSGDQPETSLLTWAATSASRGIAITKTISLQPALIENISLVDDENAQVAVPTGIAISYINTHTAGTVIIDGAYQNLTVRNVIIRGVGDDPAFPYNSWSVGVYGAQMSYVTCDNVTFYGASGTGVGEQAALVNGSFAAFQFTADSINQSSVILINNCRVTWANYGVNTSAVESPRVQFCDFVNCNIGVAQDGGPFIGGPLVVRDCHLNVYVTGVQYTRTSWVEISDNLFFQGAAATSTTFALTPAIRPRATFPIINSTRRCRATSPTPMLIYRRRSPTLRLKITNSLGISASPSRLAR
jgi:hypothetical protein